MALLSAGPGPPGAGLVFLPMRVPSDVLVAAGNVSLATRSGHEPRRVDGCCPYRRRGSRGENMSALACEGLRSAEHVRRMRNIDLLVAWRLIACQPFRCWLIPCCYMTGTERR